RLLLAFSSSFMLGRDVQLLALTSFPTRRSSDLLLMNDVVDARFAKLVNVKNRSVVDQFKDDVGLVLIYNDAQLEKIIGIAVVGMDHEVGTHLVQCQHHFAD